MSDVQAQTPEKILSVEEMLTGDDVEYKVVPAWGGQVRIGSLTAMEMIEWVEANDGPAKRLAGLRLIVKSIVNEKGERIGKPEHLDRFKTRNSRHTSELVNAILELNGLNKKDAAEAAKNGSGEAPTGASPTA